MKLFWALKCKVNFVVYLRVVNCECRIQCMLTLTGGLFSIWHDKKGCANRIVPLKGTNVKNGIINTGPYINPIIQKINQMH